MKIFNLVYKTKKEKTEKRCGGLSVNGICFNKIKFLKLLPSCKSVHPLQRSYLKEEIQSQMLNTYSISTSLLVFEHDLTILGCFGHLASYLLLKGSLKMYIL